MDISSISKSIRVSTLCVCALMSTHASGESYFGFAPLSPEAEATSAIGSGKNGYSEVAVTLDPSADPVVDALKGCNIIGIRCNMRADYKQKNKRTSAVNIRHGALTEDPVKNYADFTAGWNEIMLDSPVEIGDEPIYIGPMVYETSGNPYPFLTAHGPCFAGGFNISLNKEAWQDYSTHGNLMVQVILDKNPEDMPFAAEAALSDIPLVVAPESMFSCTMAIHNFSGEPINSVEVTSATDNSQSVFTQEINFDSPILPFDTRIVSATLKTGHIEDPSVAYEVSVSAINGKKADASPAMTYSLHVTNDAFLRIPLVEEFTSQNCVNCPFMMYYIDRAMEEFGRPLVYITRHSGFVSDLFTIPEDEELVYLFGSKGTYNPAVMYDRTIFTENGTSPVVGASVASIQPYLDAIDGAASRPGYAKIIVDSSTEGDKVSCSVKGNIANGIDIDNLFICAYLIENKIPREGAYYQLGIDDAPADAPEDLAETFSHNGIIRAKFHKQNLGDLLSVDPMTREFNIEFDPASFKSEWNAENCEVVAFIARVNKDNISDNYVLNAGGTRWNEFVAGGSLVESVKPDSTPVEISIGADRIVCISGAYSSFEIYSLAGVAIPATSPLPQGIYLVDVILHNGQRQSAKIAVR